MNKYRRRYTDDDLLKILKDTADALGRTPMEKDFEKDPDLPSDKTVQRRFGSWNEALKLAGLETNRDPNKWTNEEMINALQRFHNNKGRLPSIREFYKYKELPDTTTIDRHFGHVSSFFRAAGFEIKEQEPISLFRRLLAKIGSWFLERSGMKAFVVRPERRVNPRSPK